MKKVILFLVIVVLFVVGFYFIKNKNNNKDDLKNNFGFKIVKQNDPPFMLNFPAGLIPKTGIINVVDSFRTENSNSSTQQFTYKYVTIDSFGSIHPYFNDFFVKNGFRQGLLNSTDKYFSLNAQKDKMSVSVYAEKNINGSGTTVEINVVK